MDMVVCEVPLLLLLCRDPLGPSVHVSSLFLSSLNLTAYRLQLGFLGITGFPALECSTQT